MPKLPALRGNEVIRVLGKVGFQVIRQKGSHVRMEHEDGRVVTIPVSCWQNYRYRFARARYCVMLN